LRTGWAFEFADQRRSIDLAPKDRPKAYSHKRGELMNVRLYYQKIREAESAIPDEYPIVVSRETADGGKAGTLTEVSRRVAAKLLAEGTATLASAADADAFREQQANAKQAIDDAVAAAKVQLTVVSATELERMKGAQKPRA
jgi:hypothetical protein